jgi:hypothetical protein
VTSRPAGRSSVAALLRRELVTEEDPATAALIARMGEARRRGFVSRGEFLAMARWKSPRALHHYKRNGPARVREATRRALAARTERSRMEHLLALDGVSVPVASAILTLLDPRRYGVLDIRAWQLLYALQGVDANPAGRGFSVGQWLRYLATLRAHARRLRVPVRAVEFTLFLCHRKRQRGRLYDPPRKRR